MSKAIPATGEVIAGKKDTPSGESASPQPSSAKKFDGAAPVAVAPQSETLPRDNRYLTQAAYYLEQGKHDLACYHLSQFVQRNPHHYNGRFYYGELLLRLERLEDAREQFELVIADLQEEPFLDLRTVVHCHGRLTEIAEKVEDDFERQLHRGIALYWLSQGPAGNSQEQEEMPAESVLCKAAAALTQAQQLDPDHARPNWYLHLVWKKLGQNQPAQRFLQTAQARAAFSALTPWEYRGLALVQSDVAGRRASVK